MPVVEGARTYGKKRKFETHKILQCKFKQHMTAKHETENHKSARYKRVLKCSECVSSGLASH